MKDMLDRNKLPCTYKGQNFTCVGSEKYTNRRGELSTIYLIHTHCLDCHTPMLHTQTKRMFYPTRRCPEHRKAPARQKPRPNVFD